jgi:hypothetical protein
MNLKLDLFLVGLKYLELLLLLPMLLVVLNPKGCFLDSSPCLDLW